MAKRNTVKDGPKGKKGQPGPKGTNPDNLTAEETLKSFLNNWKVKNYTKMHDLSTATYRVAHTAQAIKALFGSLKVTAVTVGEVTDQTEVLTDINFTIKINGKEEERAARLIREEVPFRTSKEGTWGVNPISVLRKIKE